MYWVSPKVTSMPPSYKNRIQQSIKRHKKIFFLKSSENFDNNDCSIFTTRFQKQQETICIRKGELNLVCLPYFSDMNDTNWLRYKTLTTVVECHWRHHRRLTWKITVQEPQFCFPVKLVTRSKIHIVLSL